MSWCCGELVRSEERTRSPRICATAVPLVEHLDLERKDLKRKENLRMAVQRCKEQRETVQLLEKAYPCINLTKFRWLHWYLRSAGTISLM